jgi:hypothetical protein
MKDIPCGIEPIKRIFFIDQIDEKPSRVTLLKIMNDTKDVNKNEPNYKSV